jgi:hypothetical protein
MKTTEMPTNWSCLGPSARGSAQMLMTPMVVRTAIAASAGQLV